jgi:BirA family biotin operon repressor/biotin-[acetyl-CoA-carboxylase] ligase
MTAARNTRDEILSLLRRSGVVSGQELARRSGISRNAVWKHIRALRRQGYRIESSAGAGYRLLAPPDRLVPREIQDGLCTRFMGRIIHSYEELPSTQGVARDLALGGCPEGTVVLAERQTEGRGRIGRPWSSLPQGVAMSVVLRPETEPEKASVFPLLAGVAVAESVSSVTGLRARLKWPNDVLVQGRKAAGILAELSAELDRINHLVLGIGINVNARAWQMPSDMAAEATSLRAESGTHVSRIDLVRVILTELERYYDILLRRGFEPVRQAWKTLGATLGARVLVERGGKELEGTALDIDRQGALILEARDGTRVRVTAGDIRLRHRSGA